MLIVNLFAGPGAGKSTTAAGLFHKLKLAGVNAELITEYAKDKVWDKHYSTLADQLYILGQQHRRQLRLIDQVDVAITDSPLLLCLLYNNGITAQPGLIDPFSTFTNALFDSYTNLNVFLERVKPYNPVGRTQNEAQARLVDVEVKQLLGDRPFIEMTGDEDTVQELFSLVAGMLAQARQ